MTSEYVDALVETASDGISFDGLRVAGDGEYTFETPAVELTELSEAALRDVAAGSPYVTNWYFWHAQTPQKDDRWAFLRRVEDAPLESETDSIHDRYEALDDGVTTTWGQLEITVTLGTAGQREYSLSHVADGADSELHSYDESLQARELARLDDDGRYRPLKTAPTLGTGWEFSGLGPEALVEAVGFFYPATITNWHREQNGNLDVSHWTETMERQSGIYQVVTTWDRGEGHEHVEWVAESCCTDSQCLKRREWQYDEERELETHGGDGVFPCREPCSLVISAARKFTKLDAEPTHSYEFELTPSEKEQLEGLIDAVAEGRVGEIREADIGKDANRYRTRFLRARRFDEDSQLCGVPTEEE
ncbi:MAG: DR2241 family protein [Halovenus sp.]|uniref:DR2241 family protein n=1 Tax=Halovenus amylolytica TaxID=2500550 RepID=UPI000FE35778